MGPRPALPQGAGSSSAAAGATGQLPGELPPAFYSLRWEIHPQRGLNSNCIETRFSSVLQAFQTFSISVVNCFQKQLLLHHV